GVGMVRTLHELGLLAQTQGDLARARHFQERALDIRRKLAPEGLDVVRGLNALASVELDSHDWVAGEQHSNEALKMVQRLATGSQYEAQALHDLGRVYLQTHRQPEAIASLCGALDKLDLQRQRVGGSQEGAAGFAARYADYDHDCIKVLLAANRAGEALQA